MRARSRPAVVLFLFLSLIVLGGCDPDITVSPEIDLGDPEVGARVEALEGDVERLEADAMAHKARADALEGEVERLQEENVVIAHADGFTFRLNMQAAIVLVIACLCLTTFFVARLKFGADGRSPEDEAP